MKAVTVLATTAWALVAALLLTAPIRAQDRSPPQAREETILEASRLLNIIDAKLRVSEGSPATPLRLERLRLLYFLSVAEDGYVDLAGDQIAALESTEAHSDRRTRPVIEGFRAALEVVRGKHAFWPHQKVGHVRDGLARLDELIEESPDLAELRYLRLLSCYYLPFFFRRSDTVKADMAALVELLPRGAGAMSQRAHAAVTRFVLEHGEFTPPQSRRLRSTLISASAGEDRSDSSGNHP